MQYRIMLVINEKKMNALIVLPVTIIKIMKKNEKKIFKKKCKN